MSPVRAPLIGQLVSAARMLNPSQVRAAANRRMAFGVLAANDDTVDRIHEILVPGSHLTVPRNVLRIATEDDFRRATLGFSERGFPHPVHFCGFDERDPENSVAALLDDHEAQWLALGRSFPGLRRAISERLIRKVAKENTLFAVATSLPNVVPTLFSLPWAVGEFASDTTCLTANQVRLAFLLAAVHGHEVGYERQGMKISSIVGAAFGWRAIARQLTSKVPGGAGMASKGLIAFAGTYTVGRSLEHWFREGSILDRTEQRAYYSESLQTARETVDKILRGVMPGPRTAAENLA